MAVKITREAQFEPGNKGFRFELRDDEGMDRSFYEAGRRMEAARFQEGSIGQRIFERLSASAEAAPTPDETDPIV